MKKKLTDEQLKLAAQLKQERAEIRKQAVTDTIEMVLDRCAIEKEREYFRTLLGDLVNNSVIPLNLLLDLPIPAVDANKSRFDQIYDAVMTIAFPNYNQSTLKKMLGFWAEDKEKANVKIWRAVFPEKYEISHVLIRATSYQEAFGRACDYACRVSLRMYHKIPADLTIRVMFVSERAMRRKLRLRWENRLIKRFKNQFEARKFTPKEIAGARQAGLGSPKQPQYATARYAEWRDLLHLRRVNGVTKLTEIEHEVTNFQCKKRKSNKIKKKLVLP